MDPLAGLSQVTVLASRVFSGEKLSAKGKEYNIRGETGYGEQSAKDVIFRFAESKLAPGISFGLELASGQDFMGKPIGPAESTAKLFIPLSAREVKDIMEEHGVAKGTAISVFQMLGWGVQTHNKDR
jgi:hypothetical protein